MKSVTCIINVFYKNGKYHQSYFKIQDFTGQKDFCA